MTSRPWRGLARRSCGRWSSHPASAATAASSSTPDQALAAPWSGARPTAPPSAVVPPDASARAAAFGSTAGAGRPSSAVSAAARASGARRTGRERMGATVAHGRDRAHTWRDDEWSDGPLTITGTRGQLPPSFPVRRCRGRRRSPPLAGRPPFGSGSEIIGDEGRDWAPSACPCGGAGSSTRRRTRVTPARCRRRPVSTVATNGSAHDCIVMAVGS